MLSQFGSDHGLSVLAMAAMWLGGCAHAPCPPAAAVPAEPIGASEASEASAAPAPPAPTVGSGAPDLNLVGFSRATCLSYYLQEKGWDAESARNIAGGYVELGTASAEAYEALSNFIRGFEPPLGSQQPIDKHLSRCFQIELDAEWQRLVSAP